MSQQTSLWRKGFDSFNKGDLGPKSKIEAIFSDNGGTWSRLSNFPAQSTIMGKVLSRAGCASEGRIHN